MRGVNGILSIRFLAVVILTAAFLLLLSFTPGGRANVRASSWSANPLPPLLSCPNLEASADNKVTVGDILAVIQKFGKDYGQPGYAYLFDPVMPYNKDNPAGTGQIRVADILYVVGKYAQFCPQVDTQVAKAALWAFNNAPLTEDVTALSAIGYVRMGPDAPGQGVHYINFAKWDGTFDTQAPEGLVYDNGKLAAELFVVDGNIIGWVAEDLGPNQGPCNDGIDNAGDGVADAADPDCAVGPPSGPPLDDVNIDTFTRCVDGASATVPCTWSGTEGWHVHHYLCIVHIGSASASPIPINPGTHTYPFDDDCLALQNATPCSGTGCPGTWRYDDRVGWMGHLWSFLPNANAVPDVNGTQNGRFADCYPDGGVWKAYNCPQ